MIFAYGVLVSRTGVDRIEQLRRKIIDGSLNLLLRAASDCFRLLVSPCTMAYRVACKSRDWDPAKDIEGVAAGDVDSARELVAQDIASEVHCKRHKPEIVLETARELVRHKTFEDPTFKHSVKVAMLKVLLARGTIQGLDDPEVVQLGPTKLAEMVVNGCPDTAGPPSRQDSALGQRLSKVELRDRIGRMHQFMTEEQASSMCTCDASCAQTCL